MQPRPAPVPCRDRNICGVCCPRIDVGGAGGDSQADVPLVGEIRSEVEKRGGRG